MRALVAGLALVAALAACTAMAQVDGHCYASDTSLACSEVPPVDAEGVLKPGMHAIFGVPTNRYPHAVLGDDLEWSTLALVIQGTAAHGPYLIRGVELPPHRVFEDLVPRMVDLDGNGVPEIVVVESDSRLGAELAVYGYDADSDRLVKLAATPPIGTAFRWLAPAGIADFDDDGRIDFAYVETPHLGKRLRIWTWDSGTLVERASASGLTNHRIGEDFISGGLRTCGPRPEIVLANANWTRIIATSFDDDGVLQSRDVGPFDGPDSFATALAC